MDHGFLDTSLLVYYAIRRRLPHSDDAHYIVIPAAWLYSFLSNLFTPYIRYFLIVYLIDLYHG